MVLSPACRGAAILIPALINAVIVPPLLALALSAAVIAALFRTRAVALFRDEPNARSLHEAPTPRFGGIGIVAGTAAAWGYAGAGLDSWALIALALLIGISLLDDARGVAVGWRFIVHLAAALLACGAILHAAPWWLQLLAAAATAWLANLYNFMDGADGLAGGMTVIGFGAYGAAALAGGDISFAALNLSLAAAALAFLGFNFPPARVFMGDVGAIPLGFLAAVLDIAGALRGDWPAWFGVVVFSPFIVDATVTLLKRLLRGAKVWQAHREHYYQRLVQCGWGHRRTALAEYALMAFCAGAAILIARADTAEQITALIMLAATYAILIVVLERRLPRHA